MTNDSLAAITADLPDFNPQSLPLRQAQAIVDQLIWPPRERQILSLAKAGGRVLAADVISPLHLPALDAAAADGYALRGNEIQIEGVSRFVLTAEQPVPPGHCMPVRQGDPLPAGFDTVVPTHAARVEGALVTLPRRTVWPGDFRRRAGDDMPLGSVALAAGRRLRPIDLALLSTLGLTEVPVWRRLRVAVLALGEQHEANRHALLALLDRLGAEGIDLGSPTVEDADSLHGAYLHGARASDVILSTGCVEQGEQSMAACALAELGQMQCWNLSLSPGGTMALACVGEQGRQTLVFALPGDPMTMLSLYHALVRDALLGLAGAQREHLPLLRAAAARGIRKQRGRTEFKCGRVDPDPHFGWIVEDTAPPGCSTLGSMSRANGIILLDHDQGDVLTGQLVNVMPFEGLN